MYNSGIEIPQVDFSTIAKSLIPLGSYFVGFDLGNLGKLSKMDNAGVITVIEGASSISKVSSVTGLNTDNTDPQNPIVQIAVDGITITGLGTSTSPLVASGGSGTVNGSGTLNYVSKFIAIDTIGDSQIFDNGTNVGIGTISPNYKLDVTGDALFYDVRVGRGNGNQISNTVVGNGAGSVNTIGTFNSFFGYNSGSSNTTGESNAFFGYTAGEKNISGNNNTFIGDRAGQNNTTGSYNTFIGTRSGFNSAIGSNNTFIGDISGEYLSDGLTPLTLANNSVFIGKNTQALADSQTNQIVIGYNATGQGSNTIQLGNTSITDTYLQGILHVNNTWTLPTIAPTTGQVLGYSGAGVSTWVTPTISNSQKIITYPGDFIGTNYTLTSADDGYSIIVVNGSTAVSITVPTGLVNKMQVGFIQDGTGDITITPSGTTLRNAINGYKIKGQYDQVLLERSGSSTTYYLLGNTKV